MLTQDRSVAQKPHWGFCCCANASLPMAGRTGSSHYQQRETGRSRRGTPCCTYLCRMWIFQGASAGRTLFLFCPERANCAITYYNPAQLSKCLYYTTICATFLLNAHLSGCQNYKAFLSERLRLLCQKIPDTLCSRPRNNYIRLNSALVHAIPF